MSETKTLIHETTNTNQLDRLNRIHEELVHLLDLVLIMQRKASLQQTTFLNQGDFEP